MSTALNIKEEQLGQGRGKLGGGTNRKKQTIKTKQKPQQSNALLRHKKNKTADDLLCFHFLSITTCLQKLIFTLMLNIYAIHMFNQNV